MLIRRKTKSPQPAENRSLKKTVSNQKKKKFNNFFGLFGKVTLFLVFLSLGAILILRFVPPPTTAFMVERFFAGLFNADKKVSIQYNWIKIDKISPCVALAVVASEDQKFPYHWGFDFKSIADALKDGQKRGRYRGASTITQQVAKNLFLWNGRSYIRKGFEAYFTVLLELMWPKKRILEIYLNVVEFGDGIYGVHAAGQAFFKKQPGELTKSESALLAAVLPNPQKYKVKAPSKYVMRRARHIEKQMRNLGDAYLKNLTE